MADLQIAVEVVGKDNLSGTLEKTQKGLGGLVSGLGSIGLAANGIGVVTGAVQGFAQSLTAPAQEMEMARARLNAFTKDSAQTETILKAVRAEADKTPFSFGEMASAAASLAPIAQRSGVSLESLLQSAEALSASDPLQGFEGAVVALREAAGGELTSLRERFEVDTRGIAEAMKSGVPAAEALTEGLGKVGINMDLVRGMANTTAGRMSTFNDTLEGIRRTAGEEILKGFGTQLDSLGKLVTDNVDVLNDLAKAFGQGLAAAIELAGVAFAAFAPILRDLLTRLAGEAPGIIAGFQAVVRDLATQFTALAGVLFDVWQAVAPVVGAIAEQLQPVFEFLARNLMSVVVPAFVVWALQAGIAAAATIAAMLPVVIPIVAIGAVIMLLNEAWNQNWGDIQGKVEFVWGVLQPLFAALGAALDFFVTVALPAQLAAWSATWSSIQLVFSTVWNAMQAILETIWPIIKGIIDTGLALLQGDWTKAWETVQATFGLAWTAMRGVLDGAIAGLLGALGRLATDAADAAKSVGEAIVNAMKDAVSNLGGTIKDALMAVVNAALDAAKNAISSWRPSLPSIPVPKIGGVGAGGEPIIGGDIGAAPGSQNAIAWAMSRQGQGGWAGWCERFVENAFGTGGRYPSAWAAAQAMTTNAGGSMANAPAGSIMFFKPHASNGGFGHVGISLGNGQMISATNNGPEVTGINNYWAGLYHGWGPPKFANGVRGFGGGLAVVGERGWELASLPRGSNVYSHGESQRMLAGAGGVQIHFHGPIYGFDEFEDRVVQATERAQRRGRQ